MKKSMLILSALGAGAFLLCVAMLSQGYDWYISEMQAELHYSALMDFHEIPIFSYFINGGNYLFQDPQNTLLSPATIFIVVFGPHAGIRWVIAFWGVIGFLGMFKWLKIHVSDSAAWLGSLLWVINLAVIWRIIVGNDMFMLNLGLPWFLLLLERIVDQPRWKYSVLLGSLGGIYLLGPSFHTLFYLILPACSIWIGVLLITKQKWQWQSIWKIVLYLGVAGLLSVLIALPKLYAMRQFEFNRLLCAENSILQPDAWKSLFDQSVAFGFYHMVSPFDIDRCAVQTYGTWESNIALFSLAYIFVMLGIISLAQFKRQTSLHVFVIILLGSGWLLATWPRFWYVLTVYISEGVRVSSRYLILINLAFVVLAALGWQLINRYIKHRAKYWILGICAIIYLLQGAVWLHAARTQPANFYGKIEPMLLGKPIWSDHQPKINRDTIRLAKDRSESYAISQGKVVIFGYFITGNATLVEESDVIFAEPGGMFTPISPTLSSDRLQLTHRSIKISQLQPNESAVINLLPGQLGQSVTVTPELPIQIDNNKYTMTISNISNQVIEEIIITPQSSVPVWVWLVWAIGLTGGSVSVIAVIVQSARRRN